MRLFIANFTVDNGRVSWEARTEMSLAACLGNCSKSDTKVLHGGSTLTGRFGTPQYTGPSLVVDLPLDKARAEGKVNAMIAERWTNEATRLAAVEFNVYNANLDVAVAARASVEVSAGGKLEPFVEYYPVRLDPFSSASDNLRVVLEILVIVFIVYYVVIEVIELYLSRLKYFRDIWNYLELANLLTLSIAAAVYQDLSRTDVSQFEQRDVDNFLDLATLAKRYQIVNALQSLNLLWGFLRFFKYFRLWPRFMLLWDAMSAILGNMGPAFFGYALLTLAFASVGRWTLGSVVFEFRDYGIAMMFLFQYIIDGTQYEHLWNVSSHGVALPYIMLWSVISTLIFVNLLIAVVITSFAKVKERARKVQEALEAGRSGITGPPPQSDALYIWEQISWPFRKHFLPSREKKLRVQRRKRVKELRQIMSDVNLENLWDALQEHLEEWPKRVTVEPSDLEGLFDDEQAAKLFIDQVSRIAGLPEVESHEEPSTMEGIIGLEERIAQLSKAIDGVSSEAEKHFPSLERALRSAAGSEESEVDDVGDLFASFAGTERSGTKPGKKRIKRHGSADGRIKPKTGELRLANAYINQQREILRKQRLGIKKGKEEETGEEMLASVGFQGTLFNNDEMSAYVQAAAPSKW